MKTLYHILVALICTTLMFQTASGQDRNKSCNKSGKSYEHDSKDRKDHSKDKDGYSYDRKESKDDDDHRKNDNHKVSVCHVISTNPLKTKTLSIDEHALKAHLAHGDYLGSCDDLSSFSMEYALKNVSCNGSADGAIDISVSPISSNYSFYWSNGSTSEDISGLSAGVYYINVVHISGKQLQDTIMVTEPMVLSATLNVSNTYCKMTNGSATINVSGGTAPYTYLWDSLAGNQSSATISGMGEGFYSVEVLDANSCSISATASIYEDYCTKVQENYCGRMMNLTDSISCNPVANAEDYEWEFTNLLGNSFYYTRGTAQTSISLGSISGLQKNNGYSIRVRAKVNGTWAGFSEVCSIVIPKVLLTKLSPKYCGYTAKDLNDRVTCLAVQGAQNYEWKFTDILTGTTFSRTRNSPESDYFLIWINGLKYGHTYSVLIRAQVNGEWGFFGESCLVTIPSPIPYTNVSNAYCGDTVKDLNAMLTCDPVAGAQNYEWKFTDIQTGNIYIRTRNVSYTDFYLVWVPGLRYGHTYSVEVRAQVASEWGYFGDACLITIPAPVPYTKVSNAYCGITVNNLKMFIACDPVAGAQNYQWRFINDQTGDTIVQQRNSTSADFYLEWAKGLRFDATYSVFVRAQAGGEWGHYGTSCSLSIISPMSKWSGDSSSDEADATPVIAQAPSAPTNMELWNLEGQLIYKGVYQSMENLNASGSVKTGIYLMRSSTEDGNQEYKKVFLR